MEVYRKPLAVYHVNGRMTDDRPRLIEECIEAFHMRKDEAELLRFYALKCSNGFAPAAAYITKQTGLIQRQIYRSRALLIEDGLIVVDKNVISIDWDRIRLFAFLKDEKAENGTPAMAYQRKNRSIAPAQAYGQTRDAYIANLLNNPVGSAKREEGLDIYCYLTWRTDQLVAWLDTLTEEEYNEWKRSIKKFLDRFPQEKNCHYTIDSEEGDSLLSDTDEEEKNCQYTIDTEKNDSPVKWSDLPNGDIKLPNPNSYALLRADEEVGQRIIMPELFENIKVKDKSREEYIEEGWIDTYDLPF